VLSEGKEEIERREGERGKAKKEREGEELQKKERR
jgi:hypothetical protein